MPSVAATVGAGAIGLAKSVYDEGAAGNTATQKQSQRSGIDLRPESDIEKTATGDIAGQYGSLKDLLGRGPGASAVDASNASQQDYIKMLQQINATGGVATQADRQLATQFTNDLFNPQQTALNQNFQQGQQDAARLAAQMNRPINDPIIQAKLLQERMRQQQSLDANKSAYNAQQIQQAPFQRLQLQGQLADAQGSIATQAMNNRMQLLNLGNSLQSQERNWRLQTSDRWGSGEQSQHSGGGILGGIGAVTGVAGSIMGVAGQAMSLGSGMGGGGGANNIANAQAVSPGPGGANGVMGTSWANAGAGSYNANQFAPQAATMRTSRMASPTPAYTGMGSTNYQAPQQPSWYNLGGR